MGSRVRVPYAPQGFGKGSEPTNKKPAKSSVCGLLSFSSPPLGIMPLTAHTAAADIAYKLSCRPNRNKANGKQTYPIVSPLLWPETAMPKPRQAATDCQSTDHRPQEALPTYARPSIRTRIRRQRSTRTRISPSSGSHRMCRFSPFAEAETK